MKGIALGVLSALVLVVGPTDAARRVAIAIVRRRTGSAEPALLRNRALCHADSHARAWEAAGGQRLEVADNGGLPLRSRTVDALSVVLSASLRVHVGDRVARSAREVVGH